MSSFESLVAAPIQGEMCSMLWRDGIYVELHSFIELRCDLLEQLDNEQ